MANLKTLSVVMAAMFGLAGCSINPKPIEPEARMANILQDQPQARQGAEMARLAVEGLADVGERIAVDDHEVLAQRIAGLPSQLSDEDEEAKRFDMLVLRAQLSMLQARPDFAALRQKIQTIASKLEDEMAIPAIKAEALLIQAVASDEWWEDVIVPMLETARRRLRSLVKLLPKGEKKVVYTDFDDEVGDGTVIDLPQVTSGLNMAKFKDKARAFLREHESHLALQRLRRNQALTPTDLDELMPVSQFAAVAAVFAITLLATLLLLHLTLRAWVLNPVAALEKAMLRVRARPGQQGFGLSCQTEFQALGFIPIEDGLRLGGHGLGIDRPGHRDDGVVPAVRSNVY